jgi:hypothetical protein
VQAPALAAAIDGMAKRNHLAPFREGPEPYLVLARNAVPAAGVLFLGWPVATGMFMIWFDGVAALAALFALQVHAMRRADPTFAEIPAPVAWLVMMLILGIPYWFMLGALAGVLLPGSFWTAELREPVLLAALGAVLLGNLVEEGRYGYAGKSPQELRREFDWQFHMHLARVATLLLLMFFFRMKYFVVAAALALAYVEIYPMRALRFFGAADTLDRANLDRSKD